MKKDRKLDQFFTKNEVTITCLNWIKLKLYPHYHFDLIVEPACGAGSFYDNFNLLDISERLAFDIDKKNDYAIQKDYLTTTIEDFNNKENILIVGNPPFGKRSKLAVDFLLHSLKFSNIICFILPISFRKYEIQNKIIKSYPNIKLVLDELLPSDSFLLNNKPYSVRCCFQIWMIDKLNLFDDLKLTDKRIIKHPDFEMFLYNITNKNVIKYFDKDKYGWSFEVLRQGHHDYNRRETNPENMEKNKQWIFFKSDNKQVLDNLWNLDFNELSKLNISTPGFGKADIIKYYNEKYERKEK